MGRNLVAQTSHLHRLPTELVQAILYESHGLKTLLSAILSCRRLYDVFVGDSSRIATRAVINELDSYDVRPEAIAALRASKLTDPTRQMVQDLCTAHLQKRSYELSIRMTFDEAISASKLHAAVSRLAEDFTKAGLRVFMGESKNAHTLTSRSLEPSTSEKCRIMRAFYLSELFFNLFRQTFRWPIQETCQCMNDFLLTFAHWEIEQIACIHDYLYRLVAPIFNDMAAHDIYWGTFGVAPALCFCSPALQNLLYQGSIFLESLGKARTYTQQCELFGQDRYPEGTFCSLYRALHDLYYERSDDQHTVPFNFRKGRAFECKSFLAQQHGPCIPDFEDSHHYASTLKRSFFDDPDDGSFIIWKWAHKLQPLSKTVINSDNTVLREGGYVMWDRARLDDLGILHDDWRPIPRALVLNPDAVVYNERWRQSWQERARIYAKGGHGWWDSGDESQISWSKGKKKRGKSSAVPTSL